MRCGAGQCRRAGKLKWVMQNANACNWLCVERASASRLGSADAFAA
jgi:hypothetical protein